jgi:hypothetical protein
MHFSFGGEGSDWLLEGVTDGLGRVPTLRGLDGLAYGGARDTGQTTGRPHNHHNHLGKRLD